MKIVGHRGAYAYEPENTLRSIARAIELEADMVEIDVFLLPTGELILMHDDRVDRTTNGSGITLDMSFAELRQLDAGKGECIPTLEEVIALVDRRVPVNIEIKNAGSAKAVAERLEHYLARGWQPGDFVVASFNHHELHAFIQRMPQIQTAALLYSIPVDYAAFGEQIGADIVAPATDMVTPEFVADAHQRGLLLYCWVWQPVYDEETRRLYTMGVDGLYTDHIDETQRVIASLASQLPDQHALYGPGMLQQQLQS